MWGFLATMKTHDYTNRYWGHDYGITEIINKDTIRMYGWGRGIKKGDFILLENNSHGIRESTRYKITAIEYKDDPPDMWTATAKFAPRMIEVFES